MKNKSLTLTLAAEGVPLGRDSALSLSAPRSAAQREPLIATDSAGIPPAERGRGRRKRGVPTQAIAALAFALTFGAPLPDGSTLRARAAAAESKTLYTCGMHPQIIQDHPGNCPICGMKLTPIRKQDGSNAAAASTIVIDPATTQNMNLRTGVVTNGPLRRVVRSVGVVEFDEAALADVTTKFKGWIEKIYADTTGKQVHRGEPLFEIYSPELYSAQVEYVLALEQKGASSDTLKASALAKLRFFDISDAQIAELEKARQAKKTLQINAPRDGIVVEKMAVEGQMADAGMKLYRLADLSLVWVIAQVYEQDLPYLKVGQDALVKLSYLPDREFRGRVTYIYPTLDEKTRTAKVRMEFHNPGFFLKPGMFATVELRAELAPAALLVPDTAVLRSGDRNTVFVALDGGHFEARTVVLGPRGENNFYQVLSGLKEGERVVVSGQFMLDSESQLREAIQKLGSPRGERAATNAAAAVTSANPGSASGTNTFVYICPMPEHVAISYEHPGQCPICGMNLVPVAEQTLAKLQPGGHVEYYTCPMTDACPTPGHGAIKYDKAGRCPVCGMTLIPVMGAPPASATNAAAGSSGTNAATKPFVLYFCPMHPEEMSLEPDPCPKCSMTMVPTSSFPEGKIAEENWRKQHGTNAPAQHQH